MLITYFETAQEAPKVKSCISQVRVPVCSCSDFSNISCYMDETFWVSDMDLALYDINADLFQQFIESHAALAEYASSHDMPIMC